MLSKVIAYVPVTMCVAGFIVALFAGSALFVRDESRSRAKKVLSGACVLGLLALTLNIFLTTTGAGHSIVSNTSSSLCFTGAIVFACAMMCSVPVRK